MKFLANKRNVWFQMDGYPDHNSRNVRDLMNQYSGQQWIGRYGPVRWPPRIPDLTPLDFYVWNTLKEVYQIRDQTREDFIERIHLCYGEKHCQKHCELRRVVDSVRKRSVKCIEQGG